MLLIASGAIPRAQSPPLKIRVLVFSHARVRPLTDRDPDALRGAARRSIGVRQSRGRIRD